MNIDAYAADEDDSTENKDSSESVTYVEISSVEHPDAYTVLSQGGDIRKNAPVNDLYAELTTALAPFFQTGSKQAMLEWLLVSDEGDLDEEAISTLMENHRDD
jgi:hypothetical protein